MKRLLSYIIPQKIAEFRTPLNAYIRINDEGGKRRKLLVNGSPQSGSYIDVLWDAAIGSFGIDRLTGIRKILVLGTAGGTVIHKVHALFPRARITGVEIDPVMIDIGKKFFDLDTITELRLVHADAKDFVAHASKHGYVYDLIITDISFGRVIPEFLTTRRFIHTIRSLVSAQGGVIVNYLRELEYAQKSDMFMSMLQNNFPVVKDHVIYRNRFFFCSIV